jgi:putative transposase
MSLKVSIAESEFTKAKSLFPDDQAALKAVYLSVMNIQKKWVMPIRDWGVIMNQFNIIFENRCRL